MFFKKLALCTTFSLLSVSASVSSAATIEYQYGELLAGSFVPGSVFATLSVSTTDNTTYDYVLKTNDLDTIFNENAFIGSIAVDTSFANQESLPTATLVGVGNGISQIGTNSGGGPTGAYDFRYVLGQGQDRLRANEIVSFTSTFAVDHLIDSGLFALHVQGITSGPDDSAWYTPSAVPVPAALPLMASALGLFGIARARGKRKS
ncbi:MAG: VPLPA-CTERM sorting domain-containing protein [Pseudomonadota bacterium]